MVIILFGVSGSGKTTVGELLARELAWEYADADDFHSPENVAKMRKGVALTDADRGPWLERLRELVIEHIASERNLVLACSALKRSYRDVLHYSNEIRWVYLEGSYELIAGRLEKRGDHFFDPHLLRGQFETLEEPGTEALTIATQKKPEGIVREIRTTLGI